MIAPSIDVIALLLHVGIETREIEAAHPTAATQRKLRNLTQFSTLFTDVF
jgi:hypothetical protein